MNNKIRDIVNYSNNDISHIIVDNCSDNHNYLLTSILYKKTNKTILYVSSNIYKSTKAYDAISKVVGYENVNLFLTNEVVATEVDATNKEFAYERNETIANIIRKNNKIIITDINSISKELMPLNSIKDNIIKLHTGNVINRVILTKQLIKLGYKKAPTTNAVGFFSVRGEVIDVFPVNYDKPIRIDMFDDEVESIKFFDKDSQISIKNSKLNNIDIYPNTELIYDNVDEIISKLPQIDDYNLNKDKEDIKNYNNSEKLSKYLHYIYNNTESLLDYVDNKIVLFENVERLKESYDKTIEELNYYLSSKEENKLYDFSFFFDFYKAFDLNNVIITNEFTRHIDEIKYNDSIQVNIEGYSIPSYQNNVKALLEEINKSSNKFVLTFSKKENMNLMMEILDTKKIEYSNDLSSKITILNDTNSLSFGFMNSICVVDEFNIYKKINYKASKFRSTVNSTSLINSKDDLKKGDYVVHYDYGIGQYLGIKVMTSGNVTNDYICIHYANLDLYIPVENINMLEKYQAEEGYVPKLTTVGTNEWEKKKSKIKEKLENVARDLILLQAYRESKTGCKYPKDDEIQEAFENDFEYEETIDQLKAINDIKQDMEDGKIVDRLVCGDVGFGKTEVAIRIAMKTVLNGKQVAYLAPTTILTRQHYYTFKERMEKYGVKVALLNRLVSQKEKNEIIEKLSLGKIDVVIGTHTLLNDKIKYKDLGLLIVDEEQRFGVVHKEKIKQLKNNINVLTLTATPIPRTLQMSIIGARQMSLIETSPLNRYPVQTYVLEQNYSIVREAIYNELGRNGQVFYMHNRISDLEDVYLRLHRLVPEARIIIAHGQMPKEELENAVQSYIDKEYDILLCTSIIETGIDIPNSNTLIVEMSDRLGLAQMYQIRGRVGRTDRVSYAYFMYDKQNILTKEGEQRLNALKEFTSLGSGYKIAVRDLAIRGAGDFLGKEQSGYIDAIGMDLYMKLLNESINEVQGIKTDEIVEKPQSIEVSKHIDDSYVNDDDIKIYIHKTINTIENKEDMETVIDELTDRFGKLNEEILLYINKKYMDSLIKRLKIEEISENEFKGKIVFSKETSEKLGPRKVMQCAYEMGEDFSVEYRNKRFYVYIIKLIDNKKWIYKVIDFLEQLLS